MPKVRVVCLYESMYNSLNGGDASLIWVASLGLRMRQAGLFVQIAKRSANECEC